MDKPNLDLTQYSISEIYEALNKRNQHSKFLTPEQRKAFEQEVDEWQNSYIREESSHHIFEDLCCTRLGVTTYTDSELLNEFEEIIQEYDGDMGFFQEKTIKLYVDLIAERELLEVKNES